MSEVTKAHRILADFLFENNDVPVESTETLLKQIHANDDLIAFSDIAKNLIQILPLLKTIEPELWNDSNISPW